MELQEILHKVKWMHPRKYTIASHKKNEFDLIVKKVEKGFCTDQFLYNLNIGDEIYATTSVVDDYDDKGGPVIVVGAGSGASLAGCFLSSWNENSAIFEERKNNGDLKVYLGFQGQDSEPLLEHYSKLIDSGIATIGFSRSKEHHKTYVQDLLLEDKELLKKKLSKSNACFYVCGGHGMVRGVKGALVEIIGHDELDNMEKSGRYVQEVYGTG